MTEGKGDIRCHRQASTNLPGGGREPIAKCQSKISVTRQDASALEEQGIKDLAPATCKIATKCEDENFKMPLSSPVFFPAANCHFTCA